jgi:hypothetical protein
MKPSWSLGILDVRLTGRMEQCVLNVSAQSEAEPSRHQPGNLPARWSLEE